MVDILFSSVYLVEVNHFTRLRALAAKLVLGFS